MSDFLCGYRRRLLCRGGSHKDEPALRWFGKVRTFVHAVFEATTPHGSVYARISPCVPAQVGDRSGRQAVPVVPHIVRPVSLAGPDLRAQLGIPQTATVFGRHGGYETFNIPEARAAVLKVALSRPDLYFLLLNTRPLVPGGKGGLKNIIYLDAMVDDEGKAAFIRTCDAMLHARLDGETFGLAVAEFSVMNKPVITSSAHVQHGDADFHLKTLGTQGLYYHDTRSCEQLLLEFDRDAARRKDWNAYRRFEPPLVMEQLWKLLVPAPRTPASPPTSS